jgi:uncharacterized membrane protein
MTEESGVPDHVHENIQAISELRAQEERSLPSGQRAVEAMTTWIGRPRVLYALAPTLLAWMGYNLFARALGGPKFDPPLFHAAGDRWHLRRADDDDDSDHSKSPGGYAQRNAHLDLQVNILAEQRTAKIVALLEELRRDLPNVRNRVGPVADALQHALHLHAISSALDQHDASAGDAFAESSKEASSDDSSIERTSE